MPSIEFYGTFEFQRGELELKGLSVFHSCSVTLLVHSCSDGH